ncbi:hypothetical protein ACHAWF_018175 [Thalassiosira exigua]
MFALVLNVIVFLMILAALSSGRRCRLRAIHAMTDCFFLPVFVVLVAVSWLATSVLAFASISNADFCSGNAQQSGPAGSVLDILAERGIANDNVIHTAFTYYQSGCATEDPVDHLYQYEEDIQSGIGSANEFLVQVHEIGVEEINEQCGADVSHIVEGIGLIKDNLGILLSALRSIFDLASCKKMRPIYRQAFEGTACTDSSGSLIFMITVTFAISVCGMIMIMLRSAMYPFKKVDASPSSDDENQDEWMEYQDYLRYMSSFVNMWGGNDTDEYGDACTKACTSETSSSSSKSVGHAPANTPDNFDQTLDHVPERSSINDAPDTENPLSPHSSAADGTLCSAPKHDAINEDDEKTPLSPETHLSTDRAAENIDHSRMYTPETKQHGDDEFEEDDECMPLTPHTPSLHSNDRQNKRFNTPEFLTPGTFHRWRRHDEEDVAKDDELPETPLMASPRGQRDGVNFFSNITPLRRCTKEARATKMD